MPQIIPFQEYTFADAMMTAIRDAQRERLQEESLALQKTALDDELKTNAQARDLNAVRETRDAARHPVEMEGLGLGNRAARQAIEQGEYTFGELRANRAFRDRALAAGVTLAEFQAEDAPVQAAHGREIDRGQLAVGRSNAAAAHAGVGVQAGYLDLARDKYENIELPTTRQALEDASDPINRLVRLAQAGTALGELRSLGLGNVAQAASPFAFDPATLEPMPWSHRLSPMRSVNTRPFERLYHGQYDTAITGASEGGRRLLGMGPQALTGPAGYGFMLEVEELASRLREDAYADPTLRKEQMRRLFEQVAPIIGQINPMQLPSIFPEFVQGQATE